MGPATGTVLLFFGALVMSSASELAGCMYPEYYSPVCGSDGVTYSNLDHLACAAQSTDGLKLVSHSDCICSEMADAPVEYVCGSDGRTYPNAETLKCVSARWHPKLSTVMNVSYEGRCRESPEIDACWLSAGTPEMSVCDSDNVTYRNSWEVECLAKQEGRDVPTWENGKCICIMNPDYEPVCGSDGITYGNIDLFHCARSSPWARDTTISRTGKCEPAMDPCRLASQGFYDATDMVCASNGLHYPSRDHVACLKQFDPDVRVLHSGQCLLFETKSQVDKLDGPDVCRLATTITYWAPLCDNSGRTHANYLQFACTRQNDPSIEVVREFPCEDTGNAATPAPGPHVFDYDPCRDVQTVDRPVCASNGNTYSNHNALYCAAKNEKDLYEQHEGRCTDEDSPCYMARRISYARPVCGTDGRTYANPIALWCVISLGHDVQRNYYGECL